MDLVDVCAFRPAVIALGIASAIMITQPSGCTDYAQARRVLQDQGYSVIGLDGYSFSGCDRAHWFHTRFWARPPQGGLVHGVVCTGAIWAGPTITVAGKP